MPDQRELLDLVTRFTPWRSPPYKVATDLPIRPETMLPSTICRTSLPSRDRSQIEAGRRREVENHSHDLPIVVNDRVLGFLEYYQNGRGSKFDHCRARTNGNVPPDDTGNSAGRRSPSGPDLPLSGRKRFPSSALSEPRQRNVAIHLLAGCRIRPESDLVGR